MVSFIDENREVFGVEPICAELPIAPSTYYAAKGRPPSKRARRDAELAPRLVALWRADYSVYGAHKLWRAARRADIDVGRDQVARLMRLAGIEGVRRRRRVRTTRPAEGAQRPEDLVERDFTADAPNRLWVADLAYVATWAGVAYVCRRRRVQPDDRRLARSRRTCAPRWSSTPWRWPEGPAARASMASWRTPTPAASSPLCAGGNASTNSGRRPRSAPWAIPTTTP